MPPKELDEKIYYLIKCTAICFAFFIASMILWVATMFIPDDSFLSGLKIRWWLAGIYVFLPLMLLSLGFVVFIKKKYPI